MDHSITVADVQRFFVEETGTIINGAAKTPQEAIQGTRTRVHEALQAQVPCPYGIGPQPAEEKRALGAARNALIEARKAAAMAALPDALLLEYARSQTGRPGEPVNALHYAQKKHGQALWSEADRLVALWKASPIEASSVGAKGKSRRSIDEDVPAFALSSDGAAVLVADPFEPLRDLAGKVWRTAREAMADIARALGGPLFSWSNAGETSMWELIFQNTTFAQAPLIQGSVTAGSFFIALHTASPGQAGTQQTNEAAYTSYTRVAVARTSGGWTLTGNNPITAENAAAVTFPAATGGSETETFFSFGQETSGAGVVYGFGVLTGGGLAVSNGITPSFAIDAMACTFT